MISRKSIITLGALAFSAYSVQGLVLNEIRTDQPDNPDDEEFVEIKGTPGESLDDVWFIYIGDHSGDGAFKGSGVVERALDLTGYVIPADGIFLMIGPAFDGTTMGIDASQVDYVSDVFGNALENSDNVTAMLVRGWTEGEILVFDDQLGNAAIDIDDDDDGTPNAVLPWTEVIDAVSLVETVNGGEFYYGEAFGGTNLGPDNGGFVPSHAFLTSDTEEWTIGAYVLFEEDSNGNVIGLNPDASDTPGTENPIAPPASFPPSIEGISATFASVGDEVTVTGQNLATATAVTIGGVNASFVVNGDALVVTVPEGAVTGEVTVTNPDDTDDSVGFVVVLDTDSLVFSEDFVNGLGDFQTFSIASNENWEASSFADSSSIEISGFGADEASDDWLVTPVIDLTNVGNAYMVMGHERAFGGPPLQIKVSTDWDGTGTPAGGTWTDISVTLAGDSTFELIDSGIVDLSAYDGETIYIAIRYTSTGTGPGDGAIDRIHYLAVGGDTGGWAVTAELGLVYEYANGWNYSLDLGFVLPSNYPWIYQANFGFMYVIVRLPGEAMWLYSPTLGFVYVDEGDRGRFYLFDNGWTFDNFINPQG
ncbi:hypothetical protein G0Q06_05025 [Puniceicoccales bacterium CK1056]|uniref:IPT/TIG domain-containing protein n=1 Tax=Oceanipulchritudo coccoides TaxID=2706888 RepID=A0A6B2M0D3_9BACT|nr:choice-of-anchor J domain-containing protein [Oceanipulchritudo coccoides]NDV61806.1 hypothetical protein [Oceanipulchritudo coccoides]